MKGGNSVRPARHPLRGTRDAQDPQPDRRNHPALGHLRVRIGSLAIPRRTAHQGPSPMGHEYCGIVEDVGAR
jgi:threonine dehydrogenase-like Zn-dependent dehydrogenase